METTEESTVRALRRSGHTYAEISEQLSIAPWTVRRVCIAAKLKRGKYKTKHRGAHALAIRYALKADPTLSSTQLSKLVGCSRQHAAQIKKEIQNDLQAR